MFVFCKRKTAYERRISDWSSDVCSSDLFDVNLMATLYTCRAAIGPMKAQGSGDIINISSLAATKSGPGFSAYASSKHALNSMSDGMRQEVGGHGIRVSIVMPGATRTEVFDNISNENVRDAIKTHVNKDRTEEHTYELQSLMRIYYAVTCLKKKK